MNKHNLLVKKVKRTFLSINSLIESYFNKFKSFKKNFKKNEFIRNNRVFFGISAVVILTLSYFLVPTMYDKNMIKAEIKNQILKKYKIDISFNEKIRYGLLPKPHFVTKNLSILREKNEIGLVENFKIFIGRDSFFSFNQIDAKNLVFVNTDFNIKKDDLIFFEELLKTEPNENRIVLKKSNIFFKGEDDQLLFLNKINYSEFYYDSFNLENVLISKNEIFNIPYKFTVKNDKFNKELFVKFNSKKIRLDIENNTNYEDLTKKGLIEFLFVNKDSSLNYKIKENFMSFFSKDKKTLDGFMDFKPFYLKANLNYDGISVKELFNRESIIVDLIKSEILNNQNLNVNLNLNVKDITNLNELNNLFLNINLDQGDIIFSKSKIMWKNDLQIILNDGLLNYDEDEISLIGKLTVKSININNFYKSFQIKKNKRKDIKKIELDFVYNFDKNKFIFDNIKIDKNSNAKIDKFIQRYNSSKKIFSKKITFKNFINNFFNNYSG